MVSKWEFEDLRKKVRDSVINAIKAGASPYDLEDEISEAFLICEVEWIVQIGDKDGIV